MNRSWPGRSPVPIEADVGPQRDDRSEGERALVVDGENGQGEDFERLARISDYLENEEWLNSVTSGAYQDYNKQQYAGR